MTTPRNPDTGWPLEYTPVPADRPGSNPNAEVSKFGNWLALQSGVDDKICRAILQSLFRQTWDALGQNKRVVWLNFVSFTPYVRKAREGRNPSTGATIQHTARPDVKIRVSGHLNRLINGIPDPTPPPPIPTPKSTDNGRTQSPTINGGEWALWDGASHVNITTDGNSSAEFSMDNEAEWGDEHFEWPEGTTRYVQINASGMGENGGVLLQLGLIENNPQGSATSLWLTENQGGIKSATLTRTLTGGWRI